MAVYGHNM